MNFRTVRDKYLLFIFFLMLTCSAEAQKNVTEEKFNNANLKQRDTNSADLFPKLPFGKIQGSMRYYLMLTDNQKGLTDNYANAWCGLLKFETNAYKGFSAGISGYYVFNVGSSDLSKTDSITKLPNRYELGLFDIEHPNNRDEMSKIEELYLQYQYKHTTIKAGQQIINTPFINPQDGRMRPTAADAIWMETKIQNKFSIEGGWIYGISPRSIPGWKSVEESFGLYPTGNNIDGSKANYAHQIKSVGIAVAGIQADLTPNWHLQFWNTYVENVFNTFLAQVDWNYPINQTLKLTAAAQVIRQGAVNDGGNADFQKTYFDKRQKALVYGGKFSVKNKNYEAGIHYTRITEEGRYLMPREWGREPFLTFLPRERMEGLGDVHAFMAKLNYNFPNYRLKTTLAGSYNRLPDVKNTALNKYGMPSYTQINLDLRYTFPKILKGLEAQWLIVGKINQGETYGNLKYEFNKVDMILYNFVLNYRF